MNPDIVATILGALASLLGGGLALTQLIQRYLRILLKREEPQKAYSGRLAELTENPSRPHAKSTQCWLNWLRSRRIAPRQSSSLKTDLATMSGREQELKQRIDALEKTPLAVAEHFAKLVAPGEKRSVMGDYLLFRAGVVVSTAIALPSRGSCDEAAKQRHVADGAARGR